MTSQVWLVTGATSGLGAALTEALIARGDRVIASGRNVEKRLAHLHSENLALLELDITKSLDDIKSQISHAWTIFGNIDVLMNNAGMSSMRSAEEAEYVTPGAVH
jgi:NAD(P)-dependent dehydrogenase (short-subunit alcohol dehydrogenase family)